MRLILKIRLLSLHPIDRARSLLRDGKLASTTRRKGNQICRTMIIKRRQIPCSKHQRTITTRALRKPKIMYVPVKISRRLPLKANTLGSPYLDRGKEIRVHFSHSLRLRVMMETMLLTTSKIMMTRVQVSIMMTIMSPRFQKTSQPRKTYQQIKESSKTMCPRRGLATLR